MKYKEEDVDMHKLEQDLADAKQLLWLCNLAIEYDHPKSFLGDIDYIDRKTKLEIIIENIQKKMGEKNDRM